MFHGSITALITPFRDGALDMDAFGRLVEGQIEQGSHGLVPCGTTGESPTLTKEEHDLIVERTVALVKGRIPVIAGTGTNSTASTIESTLRAQHAGADAALIVTPYYNKPTQDGLYAHYKAVHDATDIPIIIYNIPPRCIIDMSVDTMSRLAELPRIVGVKDATADLTRPTLLRNRVGPDFCQLSGEDGTAPLCAQMQNAWRAGNIKEAETIRDRLAPLNKALFCETSPAPIKYAASQLGICTDEVRLPMLPATPAARAAVDKAMEFAGLHKAQNPAPARAAG
ncbi:MAG: 4-hydroxy-tetrahydrodipicolinate synthase [Micavibrio aeruginosavorus]|nr:4-hydroxy-tetrahydrodipicolinate synthase [Micavibrio aeruginosavorus]